MDKQKLTGLLAERLRANSEGFLERVDVKTLLNPLSAEGGATTTERQYAGRFLDAAAGAFEYNQDSQLKALMDKVAAALAAHWSTPNPQANVELTDADLLVGRSDLLGLLNYYRVTSEPNAYAAAQTSGAFYVSSLSVPTRRTTLVSAGLLEPLIHIYRFSADRKYLDVCKLLARSLPFPEVSASTPGSELTSMLTALIGYADLYEVTGDPSYLIPVVHTWKSVLANRLSATGAPVPPAGTASPKDEVIDACTAVAWMQLTFKLLRVSGEPQYGAQLERSIYNQILAGENSNTGAISAEVPLNGVKVFSSKLQGPHGLCMLSEAKAISLLPQVVWGRYDEGIAINLYSPGRAYFQLKKHGTVQIYSETAFPSDGLVQLHVEPSSKVPFALRLRVPEWTDSFLVDVAGLHLAGRPGEVVVIEREWKSGDMVRVSINLNLLALSATASSGKEIIFQRGPQILALEKRLNPRLEDVRAVTPKALRSTQFQLFSSDSDLPREWNGNQVYRMSGVYRGAKEDLLLAPFADASNYRTALNREPR